MSFFSKQKSYLGVDLGAGGIKLVELREEKNRPVLFTYGYTSTPLDVHKLLSEQGTAPEQVRLEQGQDIRTQKKAIPPMDVSTDRAERYAANLKAVCVAAKTVSKIASVSLPASAVFHSIVNLPPVGKNEFMPVLKAEVKKLLPYSIDDMILDHQIIESMSTDKNKKIMVSAVPKSIVDFYSRVFQRAGLILDALEPEPSALGRSLIGRDTAVTMVVDMGAERTNFYIIDQSVPMTSHTTESGGNKINRILQKALAVDEAAVPQIKADLYKNYLAGNSQAPERDKFISLLMPVIDPLVKQVEYSFGLYFSQGGNEQKRPEKIILTGGAAMVPFLAEHLAETFKVKCYLGDPWARVICQDKLKPLLNEIGPRMSVAIGLALKNILK